MVLKTGCAVFKIGFPQEKEFREIIKTSVEERHL